MTRLSKHPLRAVHAITVATVFLIACGEKSEAPPTQLAAKVNNGEISIHQVNFILQGQRIPAEQMPRARKEVMDRLVEQEIVVQQALTDKLDRDPETLQRLEAVRRETLARAYTEKVAAKVGRPDPNEIEAFYKEKSQLFTNRKIFRSNEITINQRPANWADVIKSLEAAKTLNEAIAVLKRNNIELPVVSNVVKASELLPIDLLTAFDKVKVGELVIYPIQQQVIIAEIIEVREAPVTQAQAGPVIEQFIMNQRRTETVRNEMKRLKESSKIALLGEFATATSTTPAAAAAPTTAPTTAPATITATPSVATPIDTKAPAPVAKPTSEADAIANGLKGALK